MFCIFWWRYIIHLDYIYFIRYKHVQIFLIFVALVNVFKSESLRLNYSQDFHSDLFSWNVHVYITRTHLAEGKVHITPLQMEEGPLDLKRPRLSKGLFTSSMSKGLFSLVKFDEFARTPEVHTSSKNTIHRHMRMSAIFLSK